MDLTHSFTVPAPPEKTWDLLTDLDRVGSCFPGATVTEASAEEFSGTVKVKLGPIAMMYAGSGKFVERDDAAHRAVIEARGKDKRGNGTASATVTMSLAPDGEGTRADVVTDLSVTGKPAQFGRGVMQDVSDKLLGQFVACIERELGDGSGGEAGEEVGDEPTAEPAGATTAPGSGAPSGSGVTDPPAATSSPPAAAPSPHVPSPAVNEPRPTARPPAQDHAIDLGAAVGPVLLKRYGALGAAALAGLVLGWLLGRRRH